MFSSSRVALRRTVLARRGAAFTAGRTVLRRSTWAMGAGAAAGAAGVAILAWPLVDNAVMPCAVRRAMSVRASGGQHDDGETASSLHLGGATAQSLLVEDDSSVIASAAAASGRPCVVINCAGVSDPRVLTWAVLQQLLQPLGIVGTALSSYCKAIYIAGSLLTGNQSHEHLNFMFFCAYLDWLSHALRNYGASPEQRPVVVIENIGTLLAFAEQAGREGDADRKRHLLSSVTTMLSVAQQLALNENVMDCIITTEPCHTDLLNGRAELRRSARPRLPSLRTAPSSA